jgi:hypothetical protein
MKKNKKRIYIVGLSLIIVASIVSILLVTRNVVGFDIAGVSQRDCVPYNVFVMKGDSDFSVDISWSTKAECVGFVLYGRDRGNLDMVAVDRVNRSKSKEHVVTLEQLLTTETYYFLIDSQEQAYGNEGIPLEFVLENL